MTPNNNQYIYLKSVYVFVLVDVPESIISNTKARILLIYKKLYIIRTTTNYIYVQLDNVVMWPKPTLTRVRGKRNYEFLLPNSIISSMQKYNGKIYRNIKT